MDPWACTQLQGHALLRHCPVPRHCSAPLPLLRMGRRWSWALSCTCCEMGLQQSQGPRLACTFTLNGKWALTSAAGLFAASEGSCPQIFGNHRLKQGGATWASEWATGEGLPHLSGPQDCCPQMVSQDRVALLLVLACLRRVVPSWCDWGAAGVREAAHPTAQLWRSKHIVPLRPRTCCPLPSSGIC